MEARAFERQRSAEVVLSYLRRVKAEQDDQDWQGLRASDVADDLGWSRQKACGALRRLTEQGALRATETERRYSRFRRMVVIRYRPIEKLEALPSWLMPAPFPVKGARLVAL